MLSICWSSFGGIYHRRVLNLLNMVYSTFVAVAYLQTKYREITPPPPFS